jgi:hypothetical protein
MRAASFMANAWMRGTIYPGRAAQSTVTLPIPSRNSLNACTTSGRVLLPADSSTSGMR